MDDALKNLEANRRLAETLRNLAEELEAAARCMGVSGTLDSHVLWSMSEEIAFDSRHIACGHCRVCRK